MQRMTPRFPMCPSTRLHCLSWFRVRTVHLGIARILSVSFHSHFGSAARYPDRSGLTGKNYCQAESFPGLDVAATCLGKSSAWFPVLLRVPLGRKLKRRRTRTPNTLVLVFSLLLSWL